MKRAILFLVVLFTAIGARAQVATVTGNLRDLGTSNAGQQNTYVQFTLQNYTGIPRVVGTNAIVSPAVKFQPNASGVISGSIQENNSITANGQTGFTFYQVCIYFQGNRFQCNNFIINANFNLNTATPTTTSALPLPPSLVGLVANIPTTCMVGQVYFATDATPAGANLFFCTTTNIWTQIPTGGGSATPGIPAFSLQYANAGVTGFLGASGLTTPDGSILNVKGPIPWIDTTNYGMRAILPNNTITVTTGASSPTVTTTGVSNFIKNDSISIPTAGNATAQSTPTAPTVTPLNATGAVSISYECVGVDAHWGLTAASPAGTTTTAPTVFGIPAVGITSISRSSNVVTVTAASTMAFSSGTYHATIVNVTGGATQFSGLQLVTVTSGTTLTYSQTGSNESGTVSASSYILFSNAFIVTQAQATAGSNLLVLTTDVNHNIPFVSSGTRPTMVFLDGINFSGATPPGYANGVFGVTAVTANTITVATQYTSPITTTGTANANFATSIVAQMTVTAWATVDVACPAISGTTKYYAVYGNYGSGYAPIGFTPWLTNIFEDYGPAYSKTGFHSPVPMALPATPPASAQNQIFSGQIQSISGSTLTLTSNVPTAVTSVTAYHDNGTALLNAVAASCTPISQGIATVYIPRQTNLLGFGEPAYYFSAPVDLSTACNRIIVVDNGAMKLDGTIYADSAGGFYWQYSTGMSGATTDSNDVGPGTLITGLASPMMVPGIGVARISGMSFVTGSSGQTGLMFLGANSLFKDDAFTTGSFPGLTSVPFVMNVPNGFQDVLMNTYWSGDGNIAYPIAGSPQDGLNTDTGQVHWWPVPVFDIFGGTVYPYLKVIGANYGNLRGWRIDNLYGNGNQPPEFTFEDVQTFQDPIQPLVTIWGMNGAAISKLDINRVQTDSVQMPNLACVTSNGARCAISYTTSASLTQADGTDTSYTGPPSSNVFESLVHGAAPAQNTNEVYQNPSGFFESAPGQFQCNPTTGNTTPTLSSIDNTGVTRTSITCPGGLLSIGGTTSSTGTATQANTSNRTYTFPDITGTVPLFTPSPTSGDSVIWSGTLGLLADSGGKSPYYTLTPINGDCITWNGVLGLLGQVACPGGGGGMNQNMSNMSIPTLMNTGFTCVAVNTCFVGTQAIPMTQVAIGTVANQSGTFDTSALTANRVMKFPDAASSPVQNCPSSTHQFMTQVLQITGACTIAQPTLADIAAGTSPAGLYNFSGSTIEIPQGAGATAGAASTLIIDTTAKALHAYINTADSIVASFASAPAGSKCAQTSGTIGQLTEATAVCGTTTPTSSDTFTNKIYKAEGTGNALSEPSRAFFQAGGCNNTTAGNGFDIGTTNAPTPQCAGSTVRKGVLQYARGNVAYLNFHLPNDWDSTVSTDINLCVTTSDTTNAHVISFNVQTGFNSVTGVATDDPALNSSQALNITIGASQVSGGEICGGLTGMTMTGSNPNYNFEVALTRNNSGTDTSTDTGVAVKSAEIIYGVTKNSSNR